MSGKNLEKMVSAPTPTAGGAGDKYEVCSQLVEGEWADQLEAKGRHRVLDEVSSSLFGVSQEYIVFPNKVQIPIDSCGPSFKA